MCYVQFPQRLDGVDRNDRNANHNTVFFDVSVEDSVNSDMDSREGGSVLHVVDMSRGCEIWFENAVSVQG